MDRPRIHRDPAIMVGKPCIEGTRITVQQILREGSGRASFDEILQAYPRLTREDVLAAMAYAADFIDHESLIAG